MAWPVDVIRGIEGLFLVIGSYQDVKTRKLPLEFLVFFAGIGILWNLIWKYQSTETLILGIGFGGMFFVISKVSREAIGLGDAWGILILGIFEGWSGVVSLVFAAFLLSSIYGGYQMTILGKRAGDTMPFFPFLFLAFLGGLVI